MKGYISMNGLNPPILSFTFQFPHSFSLQACQNMLWMILFQASFLQAHYQRVTLTLYEKKNHRYEIFPFLISKNRELFSKSLMPSTGNYLIVGFDELILFPYLRNTSSFDFMGCNAEAFIFIFIFKRFSNITERMKQCLNKLVHYMKTTLWNHRAAYILNITDMTEWNYNTYMRWRWQHCYNNITCFCNFKWCFFRWNSHVRKHLHDITVSELKSNFTIDSRWLDICMY
jgi:hypothetical protein